MTRCPFATWKPITANIKRGGRQTIRGFVPHVQVGNGSLFGFFNRPKPPGQGASADFWCSKTGVLEEYVDLVDQSWAQGSKQHNGNPYMVSCEFEGYVDEPMTDAQIDMGGRLMAWVWAAVDAFPLEVNLDPEAAGVTPHHVFGGGHTCPDPLRESQFPDLIAAAKRHLNMEEEFTMDQDARNAFDDLANRLSATYDVAKFTADRIPFLLAQADEVDEDALAEAIVAKGVGQAMVDALQKQLAK